MALPQLTQEGSPFTGSDVADDLGKPVRSLSELRARPLAMGALTYDERGLAFATRACPSTCSGKPGTLRSRPSETLNPGIGERREPVRRRDRGGP